MNPIWSPSKDRVQNSELKRFIDYLNIDSVNNYESLYQYSIDSSDKFWKNIFSFYNISFEGDLDPAYKDKSFDSYTWFENVRLNFSKNLLKNGRDEDVALVSRVENGNRRTTTYKDLRANVSGLSKSLRPIISKGDVLACYMPNISQTIEAMLATTALGGVFTSTSADFGIEGVVDRFGQSRPKVLITVSGYEYNGKYFDLRERVKKITETIDSIEKVIFVDYLERKDDISSISNACFYNDFFEQSTDDIEFVNVSFSDPLYIMYSSGTTGKPKCIVHSVGGTLLQHVKELGLHTDLKADKNIFFFTTCGWMMWNWLVSSLYFGSTVILYEGSPAYPTFIDYLKLIEDENIHIFGTSPKFLRALSDTQVSLDSIKMDTLETILSTGAPLLEDQFEFVYNNFKKDILLASISGGTDIIGCFFLGCPINPIYSGRLQVRGLGMHATSIDESGVEVLGREGELVCLSSFPSRPIYFLNDPENERINDAYFNKINGLWYHGDYIKIDEYGIEVLGRSDSTLNPGGVRIGTAEIYRQTEVLSYIEDSVCVGKQVNGDVDVWLFVVMKEHEELTTERIKEIKRLIKTNTTPRHMPRRVMSVPSIPYTRSGKKMEIAVTKLINGKELNNIEAVSNPDSLSFYKDI